MSRPRLLIVEDDAGLCAQYRWAFPEWRLTIAHDRRHAELLAKREPPEVALLDLGLPPDAEGTSEGFATLDALRQQFPKLPVIICSGQGDRAHMLRAVAAGAYDFCEKPVDLEVLRTVLDRALRLSALEEENHRLAGAPKASPIVNIITADPAMLKLCQTVERLASVAAPARTSQMAAERVGEASGACRHSAVGACSASTARGSPSVASAARKVASRPTECPGAVRASGAAV